MEPIKFNINHNVKVKLTEQGYNIWFEYENRYVHYNPKTAVSMDELTIQQDSEGYTTFQLWVLMEIFGSHIGMGFKNPFETNIILLPE